MFFLLNLLFFLFLNASKLYVLAYRFQVVFVLMIFFFPNIHPSRVFFCTSLTYFFLQDVRARLSLSSCVELDALKTAISSALSVSPTRVQVCNY